MNDSPVPARPPWWFRSVFGFVRSPAPLDARQWSLLGLLGLTLLINHYAFARDAAWFTACQFGARMFIAAEEMLAVVVLAEELGAQSRGFGIGILSAFGALGFGAAALALALVEVLPFGWRALYLVGAVPLLWVAWLRRRIPETRRFEAEREARRGAAKPDSPHRCVRCGTWSASIRVACSRSPETARRELEEIAPSA